MTISWDSVAGATAYSLQYKISTDATWTVLSNEPYTITSYTLSGLSPNLQYKTRVAGVCSNGTNGAYRQASKRTTTCSTPSNVNVSGIDMSSAHISWTPLCGTSTFKLKYKLHTVSRWTNVSNIQVPYYNFSGLTAQATYDVQVQSNCGSSNSPYSPIISFTTASGHKGLNVLLILLDDSRQDPFAPDGGPSWFSNPNITRIADEGVRFRFCFPAESQCAPSRASIYTGLYPHKTGVYNNTIIPPITATTLAQILHNNNYYVGMVGKYDLTSAKQPGYDYWMENHSPVYVDAQWFVNTTVKTITGHKTDVATDSAIGFLHKVPANKSFYLEVAYAAPHVHYVPRAGDDSLYLNDTMPLADNSDLYSVNYPSFLYPSQQGPADEEDAIRGYYQMLAGVEYSVGRLLNELTAMNVLDSTLIIFTSDNGYLLGEHGLDAKRVAYEESIRLPLYMRCPPKIAAGTVIENDMAVLFDLPVTILDYLGIANTVSMDGISLKNVIEGTEHRNEFFYEFFNEDSTPDIRGVRTMDYKYIEYGCSSVTEEFFDLTTDPEENTNLINNSAYDSLIEVYRGKLAYWENYYQYHSPGYINNCHLSNPVYQRVTPSDETNQAPGITIFPNPASDVAEVTFYSGINLPYHVQLYDAVGKLVYEEYGEASAVQKKLNVHLTFGGSYIFLFQQGDQIFEKKILIQR